MRALIDPAAGDLDVLRLQRARDVGHGEVVGAQPIGVEPDVDLALPAAEDEHLADAADAFELAAQHLVGVFGDFADRLVGGQRDTEDRRGIGIEFVDARRLEWSAAAAATPIHFVPNFLGRDIGVLVEEETDHDDATRLPTTSSAARRCR